MAVDDDRLVEGEGGIRPWQRDKKKANML